LLRAKENAVLGTRLPKFVYEGIIEQASNLITGRPFSNEKSASDSPLWLDVQQKIKTLVDAKKSLQHKQKI
jgi:hypothetical protein